MADEITNSMLLGHMQAMNQSVLMQISEVKQNISQLKSDMAKMSVRMDSLETTMRFGFENAQQHR